MISAGIGTFFIDGAATVHAIQIDTVTIGAARQGEAFVLVVEAIDEAGLDEPSGDKPQGFFHLERIDYTHAHQISDAYLGWHGATAGAAVVAETAAELDPCAGAFQVGLSERYFFHRMGMFVKQAWLAGCRCQR